MMSDDHFIAINSEKPNKKGKMLKHLFWSTVRSNQSLSATDFLKNHQIIITGHQVGPHIPVWISFMQKFLLEMIS